MHACSVHVCMCMRTCVATCVYMVCVATKCVCMNVCGGPDIPSTNMLYMLLLQLAVCMYYVLCIMYPL